MPATSFPSGPSDGHTVSDGASGHRVLVRREGRPMATDVSIQIAAPPERAAEAEAAAAACMNWFDEVDRRLSRFRADSELSQLNAAAGHWFAASETLFESVSLAVAAAHASGGLFDPTLLPELEALGYDRDFALIAQREILSDAPAGSSAGSSAAPTTATPAERAGWRGIVLDAARWRMWLPDGVRLDLGGIAKGWAADVAMARYCAGFPGALVNVGGDLRVRGGPAPGEPWSVGIRHPREELAGGLQSTSELPPVGQIQPLHAAVVAFSRGGLATSGALRRWWLRGGQRQHHLLDPRTGRPMRLWIDDRDAAMPPGDEEASEPLIATATALAPTAARAEVAAKVALLRGYPDALRAIEAAWERYGAVGPETDADAGVALVLTLGDGAVALSANLPAYLETWGTEGAALPLNVFPTTPPARLAPSPQLRPGE